jgi:hypothetical protein
MRGTLMFALATLAVTALGIAEGTAAPTSRTASGYLTCTTTGAAIKVGKTTTTRYAVVPQHVTCAFANRWVTRLSYKRGAPFSGALSGGPPGWHCFATAAGKPAASGSCTDNTGAKSFSWSASFAGVQASTGCIARGAPLNSSSRTSDYRIDLHDVTCAFAKSWVARLTYKRVVLAYKNHSNGTREAYGRILGGPRGFECGTSRLEVHQHARAGSCNTGSGSKSFGWTPAS